jgi:hypothetical protein
MDLSRPLYTFSFVSGVLCHASIWKAVCHGRSGAGSVFLTAAYQISVIVGEPNPKDVLQLANEARHADKPLIYGWTTNCDEAHVYEKVCWFFTPL